MDDLLTGNSNEVKLLPTDKRKDLEDLTLRVKMLSSDGDKIRVNLPMMLVKIALEMGVEIIPNYTDGMDAIKKLDLGKIMELAERGMIGKIVEMESANGDTVEVVIE